MKINWVILDCNGICHRLKHGMKNTKLSHDQQRVEIIYSFLGYVLACANEFKTTNLIFAWDSRRSRRKQFYPEYKEHRRKDKTPEDIKLDEIAYKQFNLLRKEILPDMGFKNVFLQSGLEADDIMAEFVLNSGFTNVVLVTTDQDMFQLLHRCSIWDPIKRIMKDRQWFMDTYDLLPHKWSIVKAIGGCTSDNVKGIKGVGEKTAIKYIQGKLPEHTKKFKDIESKEGKKIRERNHLLVHLPHCSTRPIEVRPDELSLKRFLKVFKKYEFISHKKELKKWKKAFIL
jgi:DNA polymerase-1